MSDPNVVMDQLETFVRARFDVAQDDPDFGRDVHLFDNGYVDSFGAQELIAHIESTFHIKIADTDLVKYPLNTLNQIGRFVVDRQNGVR